MKLGTFIFGFVLISMPAAAGQDRLPGRTFTEHFLRSSAAVIAKQKEVNSKESSTGVVISHFIVDHVVKDNGSVPVDSTILARRHPHRASSTHHLLLRSKDRNGELQWEVTESLTPEAVQHLLSLSKQDLHDVGRLEFFFGYLEHADPVIAGNADLEFLLASDETFALFAGQLQPAEIRARLGNKDLPVHRRRLYLAMLAKCGNATDGDWIRRQVSESDNRLVGLDAYLATYVAIKGEAGLELLDEQYLTGDSGDLVSTYGAIVALRYIEDHPQPGITNHRLVQSFRLALDHPLLQDIVIHHMGRLSDWHSMDRIVEIAKASDVPEVHRATINYLRLCPGDKAKQNLSEMARRYPETYQRVMRLYPDSAIKTQSERRPASIRWTERPGRC